PYLWPARSAKPFDQKKKPAPRHQRENQLKEKTSPASDPRGAQSHLTERENLPRATSAKCRSKRPDENYSFPARTQFFKVQ
ncbi:MAG: hypothetical protein KHW66_09305, partial [Faecalibacterium prausnitzii]|nr:hypothetical protein [Faecalibacterium prausnitzii]